MSKNVRAIVNVKIYERIVRPAMLFCLKTVALEETELDVAE